MSAEQSFAQLPNCTVPNNQIPSWCCHFRAKRDPNTVQTIQASLWATVGRPGRPLPVDLPCFLDHDGPIMQLNKRPTLRLRRQAIPPPVHAFLVKVGLHASQENHAEQNAHVNIFPLLVEGLRCSSIGNSLCAFFSNGL